MKSKGIITNSPCRKCGKTLRQDYDGFCMDCADELGISEIFERGNKAKYKKSLTVANKKYPKVAALKKWLKSHAR